MRSRTPPALTEPEEEEEFPEFLIIVCEQVNEKTVSLEYRGYGAYTVHFFPL